MRRREFVRLLGGAAAMWPLAARTQQGQPTRRIGVLLAFNETDSRPKGWLSRFAKGLSELGWANGGNLRMDVRWAGDDVDRMRLFAKELVGLKPDVILAFGTPVTAALQRETQTIPIVFAIVSDPVGEGFVASLSRPGGNITGFHNSEASIGGKWLELLTEVAPGVKRAAMIFNPDTAPGHGKYYMPDFEAAARTLNVAPLAAPVHSLEELEAAITGLGREPGGGFIAMADFFLLNHRAPMIALAARNNVPAVYPWREVPTAGGLLSYGPDLEDIVRRAAPYVDRILRGANPAELPVQVPVKFETVVNVKTARALGLEVPTSILLRADEVIE
ncbi:MAG TPA: ABC transporter substrate-binding protein [Pseudolabrys sp.]|jgi:putative ABC transport system substrate-binding protein|nr:ABC transporter substrate-binding protein [Pseudolabrys sp.]